MKKLIILIFVFILNLSTQLCADAQKSLASFLPNHSIGDNFMPPDEAFGGFDPSGMPPGLPFGMPGSMPAGAEQDFYGEMANALSETLKTPEGLEELKRVTSETLGTIMADPEMVKNSPELQKMQEALAQDPNAIDGLIESFRDVMSDPVESKKLFQAFDSFASKNGLIGPDGMPTNFDGQDEFYDEDFSDFGEFADQEFVPEPVEPEVESKPAEEVKTEQEVTLSDLEIKNEWKELLLNRKADLSLRRAAFNQMAKDFDKAYSNLYWLKNSRDSESDHLSEKVRGKLDRFIVNQGGLSDYAAMIWTAASDSFATNFFIESLSGKGRFLEELVAFDEQIKAIAKIAKKAAKERKETDEKALEEGIASPLKTEFEKEVDARLDNLNAVLASPSTRIIQTIDLEFSKNPKLLALLNQKKEASKKTAQDSGKKDRWSGNNYSPQDGSYRGGYGGGYGDGDGAYQPYYGGGGYNYGSDRSSGDDSALKSKDFGKEDAGKYYGFGKDRGDKTFRSEEDKESKNLLALLIAVGKSSPETESETFFAKVEAVYNLLESKPETMDEFSKLFAGETKKNTVGGLSVKSDKDGQQPDEAGNSEQKSQKSEKTSGVKKENLVLAAEGLQKCKFLLDTDFAFPVRKQKNTPAKLYQAPRPTFYAGEKLGILDSFGLSVDKKGAPNLSSKSLDELMQAISNFQKIIEDGQAFREARVKDFKKLEKSFSDNKISAPLGFQSKFSRSLTDLATKIAEQVSDLTEEETSTIESFDLSSDAVVDKFLIKPDGIKFFESCIKNLQSFYSMAIQHRVLCPFNGVKAISTKILQILDWYEAFSERLTSPQFPGSLVGIEEKIKTGQNKSATLKNFFQSGQAAKEDSNLKPLILACTTFLSLHKNVCVLWSFKFNRAFELGKLPVNYEQPQAEGQAMPSQEEIAQAMKAFQNAQSGGFLSNAWQLVRSFFSSIFSVPYNFLFGGKKDENRLTDAPNSEAVPFKSRDGRVK